MLFKKTIDVRWADIDANQHLTHTAYATFATHTRVEWMASCGYGMDKLLESGFAAVLLKEQTEYFREIFLGETVTVELYFAGSNENHSRWKFIHKLYNTSYKLSSINTIYGAWININTRKIAPPPAYLLEQLNNLTKVDDFEYLV